MVQYRLWLHHREIDQDLRGKQLKYKQEITVINEHIARIENLAMQTDNALLTAIMQHLNSQECTTSQTTEPTRAQPAYNGATQQASLNNQKYQTPPPSNYGQQGWDKPQPLRDTGSQPLRGDGSQPLHDNKPQPLHVSPASSTWGELPNFVIQDIYTSEEEMPSLDTIPVVPEVTDYPLPSNPNSLADHEPQKNELDLLPWWLRHLMQTTPEELEVQQTAPIDQQSTHTNERVERWFTRRTKLVHYDEWQESQKQ